MTVAELVAKLLTMPQDAEVWKSDASGCHECNPEGIDYYSEINGVYLGDTYVKGYYRDSKMVVTL